MKQDLTQLDIRCCDEILIEDYGLNFTFELWFDVEEYFEINLSDYGDKDSTWVNFYIDWIANTNKLVATIDIDSKEDGLIVKNWNLTDAEYKFMKDLMVKYVKETTGFNSFKELYESEGE